MPNFFNYDGSSIEYETISSKKKKNIKQNITLIFLHEGLGCIKMWGDFPSRLCNYFGLKGLVYSRHGYGNSTHFKVDRNRHFMHDEAYIHLPKIIDFLKIQKHIIIGHSDGASIALLYGSMGVENLLGLTLLAPHVIVEKITLEGIKKAKLNFDSGELEIRLKKYHQSPKKTFLSWSKIWLDKKFTSWNILNEISKIKRPILVIQGSDDQYGTEKQLDLIKQNVKSKVFLEIIKHCRHSPHFDRPNEVDDLIQTFLSNMIYQKN